MVSNNDLTVNISFPPIADNQAHTVILGSMPSVKSLAQQQYYAHPRNAFWPIMCAILNMDISWDYNKRCQHLINNHIAIWDSIQACQRQGSLDQQIKTDSIIANDFKQFFAEHPHINALFFNGAKAEQVFKSYVLPALDKKQSQISRYRLPSTSPAHAAMTFEQKYHIWNQALAINKTNIF